MNESTKTVSHTPGPWHVEREDEDTFKVMSDDYGRIVTLHAAHGVEAQRERLGPDSALIAAAPELLSALRIAVDHLPEITKRQQRIREIAFIAIARATNY